MQIQGLLYHGTVPDRTNYTGTGTGQGQDRDGAWTGLGPDGDETGPVQF